MLKYFLLICDAMSKYEKTKAYDNKIIGHILNKGNLWKNVRSICISV